MIDVNKQIKELNKQLYPTGRAWAYVHGSEQSKTTITNFVDGLGNPFVDGFGNAFIQTFGSEASPSKRLINAFLKSHERYHNDLLSLLNEIIADGSDFDSIDASNWERVFGLTAGSLTLDQRKANILRRQSYPNGIAERGNYLLIQDELQAAGFDIYLTENRFKNGAGWDVINKGSGVITGTLNANKDTTSRIGIFTFNITPPIVNTNLRCECEMRIRVNNNIIQDNVYGESILDPGGEIELRAYDQVILTSAFKAISIPLFAAYPSSPPDYESASYTVGIKNLLGNTIADLGSEFEIKNIKIYDDLDNEISYSSVTGAPDVTIEESLPFTICANSIEESIDDTYFDNIESFSEAGIAESGVSEAEFLEQPPTDFQSRSIFFIGNSSFPSIIDVPLSRKNEFRQLILKLKPAQTVAYLYVNYI